MTGWVFLLGLGMSLVGAGLLAWFIRASKGYTMKLSKLTLLTEESAEILVTVPIWATAARLAAELQKMGDAMIARTLWHNAQNLKETERIRTPEWEAKVQAQREKLIRQGKKVI